MCMPTQIQLSAIQMMETEPESDVRVTPVSAAVACSVPRRWACTNTTAPSVFIVALVTAGFGGNLPFLLHARWAQGRAAAAGSNRHEGAPPAAPWRRKMAVKTSNQHDIGPF